jgi:hypothetical protein
MDWLARSRPGVMAIVCALAGCGGGGSGTAPSFQLGFALDKSSVSIAAVNDGPLVADPVHVEITGLEAAAPSYYLNVTWDHDPFTTAVSNQGLTSGMAVTQAISLPQHDQPAGTRSTGNLTYTLCTETPCKNKVWSHVVSYTITRYTIDTTPLLVTAHEGGVNPVTTLTITPADTTQELSFVASNPVMVTVDHTNTASVVFNFTPPTPNAGDYNVDIGIHVQSRGNDPTPLVTIPAEFRIDSDIAASRVPERTIASTGPAATLAGQVQLSFALGQNAAWTAKSDQLWLVVDSASGTGAGAISYHLDAGRLGSMLNWTSSTATISIEARDLTTVTVPVTVNIALPEITSVTPASVLAGSATTVHVTGRGLSQLSGIGAISVNAGSATGGGIVSDTEATLELAPLGAGPARIAVTNASAIETPHVTLGVVDRNAFTDALIPHSGTPLSMAFDPTRNAVFVIESPYELTRYRLSGGHWDTLSIGQGPIRSMALSPDSSVLFLAASGQLLEIDPDTMAVGIEHQDSLSSSWRSPMAFTNDLRLWFDNLQYFDMRSGIFGTLATSIGGPGGSPLQSANPGYIAPSDGSTMLLWKDTIPPNYWYDPRTAQISLQPGATVQGRSAIFDGRGTQLLIDDKALYRAKAYDLVGYAVDSSLPADSEGHSVLSDNGARIYREVRNSSGVVDHLEVFDSTARVADTSNFAVIGAVSLPNRPQSCTGTDTHCGVTRWLIDPTGTTLFWAGQDGLVIVPIPSSLSGVSSATRAHAARAPRVLAGALH